MLATAVRFICVWSSFIRVFRGCLHAVPAHATAWWRRRGSGACLAAGVGAPNERLETAQHSTNAPALLQGRDKP
jgi:hypothetical protein